ncbi:hypothetical protein B4135_4174 [Caldibacillus debilis]|uniref:Uncharacterized protein n=1 Tax=Caldibacillus debilis TaxID=301148 RepID=A0A150L6T4_9BACI|nr:hypothetical protein B4135_4174 [Caldibacillus debilis]
MFLAGRSRKQGGAVPVRGVAGRKGETGQGTVLETTREPSGK